MRLKRFTEFLLAHRLRVLATIVLMYLIPVIGTVFNFVFGAIYAGFVTLQKGASEGAEFAVALIVPMAMLCVMTALSPGLMVPSSVIWVLLVSFVVCYVAIWVFASLIARQMTWSTLLQVAALVGVMVVSVIHLICPDIADWWYAIMVRVAKEIAKASSVMIGAMKDNAIVISDDELTTINAFKKVMDGFVIALILMHSLLIVACARWWQAVLYAPGMLRRELHHIRLSVLAGVLYVLSQVLVIYGSGVMLDAIPIINLLFLCAGLSVVHYFFGLMVSPTRVFWIALVYVLLIFWADYFGAFISMVGFFDIWFDLRRKLRRI